MQIHTVVALCDWLAGVTAPGKGVNDYLAGVPTLEGDSAPEPVPFIGDPYRSDVVAAFDTPPTSRALYVLPDGPVAKEGELGVRVREARSVAVAVRFVVRDGGKARASRDAAYVLRAIEQSLAAFLEDDADGSAARDTAGVVIISCNGITAGPWREAVGDGMAVAVLAADFQVRDKQPRG